MVKSQFFQTSPNNVSPGAGAFPSRHNYSKRMSVFKRNTKQSGSKSKLDALLDKVLYTFPNGKDTLDVRSGIEGECCFGETGSGKTTGYNNQYLQAMLNFGMGGRVFSVKKEAARYFKKTFEKCGRKFIHFKKGSPYRFNFLEYELARKGEGAKEISNISNLIVLMSLLVGNYNEGNSSGKNQDRFWQLATERLTNRSVSLLDLSDTPITILNIRKLIVNSFTEADVERYNTTWVQLKDSQVSQDKKNDLWQEYQAWAESNFFLSCLQKATSKENITEDELFSLEIAGDYFMKEWPRLAEKTKSIVLESFLGAVESFVSPGILKEHFSEGVSPELLPENAYLNGDIVLVDFPVKEFGLPAILANGIMKFAFQTAMERREVSREENPMPVLLWVDEYQNLVNPAYDPMFQATAREALVCTVYISQSFNAIIGAMGAENAENKAKSLITNLGLKVFNANSDYDTNEFAANMIGRHFVDITSVSIGHDKQRQHSFSQQYHYQVPPEHFTTLRTGGSANGNQVEAVLFKAGKKWSTGRNFLQSEFDQRV